MQSRFGVGYLFGVPSGGGAPIMFSALQDISVDFSQDVKLLYGSQKYAIEAGGGKAKIDWKASIGRIDPVLFNQLYFGGTQGTAFTRASIAESGTVPATPFTITVANGATFKVDLGVYDIAAGIFMTRVASGPVTGQYSVNTTTGAYLFAAADTGKAVSIYYTYAPVSGGVRITSGNPVLGTLPTFAAYFQNSFGGKQTVLTLFKAYSNKLTLPFKQDDWALPAFTGGVLDDGTGNVFAYDQDS